MDTQIRCLTPDDAPALLALRLEALAQAPFAFGSSPEEDRSLGLDAFRRRATPDENGAIFGAFAGDRLAGMAGLARHQGSKRRHKAFIWGVYVSPELRGQGVARKLLEANLARAATLAGVRQVQLSVTVGNDKALALYEALGFRAYGTEPEALCVDGTMFDEIMMNRAMR